MGFNNEKGPGFVGLTWEEAIGLKWDHSDGRNCTAQGWKK